MASTFETALNPPVGNAGGSSAEDGLKAHVGCRRDASSSRR
jgi:hypothetical protein